MRQCKKTADPQMAHLVFSEIRANAQKTKRAIFSNARTNKIKNILYICQILASRF